MPTERTTSHRGSRDLSRGGGKQLLTEAKLTLEAACACLIPAACDLVREGRNGRGGIELHFEEKLEYCRGAARDLAGVMGRVVEMRVVIGRGKEAEAEIGRVMGGGGGGIICG